MNQGNVGRMGRIGLMAAGMALFTGCFSVPATKIDVDVKRGTASVRAPKDMEMQGLRFTVSNGVPVLTLESYKAKNNPEVIGASADATAKIITATGAAGGTIAGEVAKNLK